MNQEIKNVNQEIKNVNQEIKNVNQEINNVYVFRTHFYNEYIDFQWKKFQTELGVNNCYLMMDETNLIKPYHSNVSRYTNPNKDTNIIYIHWKDCCQVNKLHKNNKEQVESQLYILYKLIPQEFDYLYFIEYDVYCDGNWKETLEKNNSYSHDFLATHVDDYRIQHISWGHWFNLKGSKQLKPKREHRVKSFFPITRYSTLFFKMLEKQIGRYTGFCEIFIPSLVKQQHLTYGNLNLDCIGHHWIFTDDEKDQFKPLLMNHNTLLHPVIQILSS